VGAPEQLHTRRLLIYFIAVFTAFNFTSLAVNGPLPTDHIPHNQVYFSISMESLSKLKQNCPQTYLAGQIVPFAANLVGQVLSCPASEMPTHIRWILNDGVLPLTGIQGCPANLDGLCELSTFIAAMKQRIEEVDFDFDCFGNYTIRIPDDITDGQFPRRLRS
jgi:hypothetical protein